MKEDLQKELHHLQQKIHDLTEENEILTEKAEDIYLLGIISEKISLETKEEQVISVAIENIVTLKDIAYCSLLKIKSGSITVSDDVSLKLPESLRGNIYKLDSMMKAALQNKDYLIELKQDNALPAFIPQLENEPYPNSFYLIPIIVREKLYGMLLCLNTVGDIHYIKRLVPMLDRVGELVGMRIETLSFLSEIRTMNKSLEFRIRERTADLKLSVILLEQEIKDRQRTAEDLEKSHQRLLVVLNSIDAIVYVADMNSYEVLFINQFLKDNFGNIEGTICWQSIQIDQKGPCEFCTNSYLIDSDNNPTGVYKWEFQNTHNKHWYDIHDRAINWIDGRTVRLEIATDITERKKVEKERETLLEQLEAKNKELEQILYAGSHDLRTPLVNVKGFSDELELSLNELNHLIQNDKFSDAFREKASAILDIDIPESIGFIKAGTEKMTELLNSLLKVSRLGKSVLQLKKLDMNKLMSEVTDNFKYALNKKGVKLTVSDLPSCIGDKEQISQVFFNLLDNALKYLDPQQEGTINIIGEIHDNNAVYSVEDNGIGINPEYQAKIFEIFHQLDPTIEGEGLGLTIVNKIIEKHNGKVSLESDPGKGSTFYISLPNLNE